MALVGGQQRTGRASFLKKINREFYKDSDCSQTQMACFELDVELQNLLGFYVEN